MKQLHKGSSQPPTCQKETRQTHFPRQQDPAPHHGGRHLGADQGERRSRGVRAEEEVAFQSGWVSAPPALQLVRPGTAWLLLFGHRSYPDCRRCGLWCIPGGEVQAPPAAVVLSEVSAASGGEGGRDGKEGIFIPQLASLWRNNCAAGTYWPAAAERAFALWLGVGAAVAPECCGQPRT